MVRWDEAPIPNPGVLPVPAMRDLREEVDALFALYSL